MRRSRLWICIPAVLPTLVSIPAGRAHAEARQLNLTLGSLPEPESTPDPQALRRSGQILVTAGTPLTVAGAVLVPLAIYFALRPLFRYGWAPCGWEGHGCTADQRAKIDADIGHDGRLALATGLSGLAALGVGIPLLAVGVHRMRQADRMPVPITPYALPTHGGVVAGVTVLAF